MSRRRTPPALSTWWVIPILTLGALAPALADEARWPLTVEEVRTGKSIELGPGARALHVVFFATWCPPCLDEMQRLSEMEERWGGRGYRLALIAVRNRHTRERLLQYAKQDRPPGDLYLDASGEVQRSLGAEALPTHLLFDAAGREAGRWAALGGEVEEAIEALLRSAKAGS